jgi:hypothetical protein
MRFTFIAAKKAEHTVTILCRCLCVTRSSFYAWQARPESLHARDDRRLKALVHTSFAESRRHYGSPRVHDDLIDWQEHVSRKRVVRLMQEEGLKARVRKRYTRTTMSDHDQPVAANLLDRRFEAAAPNQRWVGDTTDHRLRRPQDAAGPVQEGHHPLSEAIRGPRGVQRPHQRPSSVAHRGRRRRLIAKWLS